MTAYFTFVRGATGAGVLCLAIAVIVIVRWALARKKWPMWPATIVLALIACSVYFSTFHDKLAGLWRIDRRAAYHYFLGAKYFRELGYADIYRFSLLADYETGFHHLKDQTEIRDQEDYELVPVPEALEQARLKRPLRFTDERWEEFKKDWLAISRSIPNTEWQRILTDRGFNPPPFWQVVASPLAQHITATSHHEYRIGLFADVAFLALALLLVGVCAGLDAALLCFCFIHLAWYYNGSVIGTYFQFVWLDAILICMAFYRRGWMIAAGAALAVSAGVALFPVVFTGGPGVMFLRDLVRTRKMPWKPFKFLASFAACTILFTVMGIVAGRGVAPTKDFAGKITMHAWNQKFDSNKFGLKRTMSVEADSFWDWTSIDRRTEVFVQQRHLYKLLFLAIVGLTLAAMIRGPDNDAWAVPLGQGIIYSLMTSSRYYYHSLCVFLIAGKDDKRRGFAALSIAGLFLIHAGFYWINAKHGDRAAYTFGNVGYLVFFLAAPLYLLIKEPLAKAIPELRGAPPAPTPPQAAPDAS